MVCPEISVATLVGNHDRSSVGIGWCFRCDFTDYNRLLNFNASVVRVGGVEPFPGIFEQNHIFHELFL